MEIVLTLAPTRTFDIASFFFLFLFLLSHWLPYIFRGFVHLHKVLGSHFLMVKCLVDWMT